MRPFIAAAIIILAVFWIVFYATNEIADVIAYWNSLNFKATVNTLTDQCGVLN